MVRYSYASFCFFGVESPPPPPRFCFLDDDLSFPDFGDGGSTAESAVVAVPGAGTRHSTVTRGLESIPKFRLKPPRSGVH